MLPGPQRVRQAARNPDAGEPAGGGGAGAAAAGAGRRAGGGASWPGPGAARAPADQPRYHRVLDSSVRRGAAAPGSGPGARAPDRAALPGVHRPGLPGDGRVLPVVRGSDPPQRSGDRAGRAARLDRRPGRRHHLHDARVGAGLAGQGGAGRSRGPEGRTYPPGRSPARRAAADRPRPRGAGAGPRPGRCGAGRVPGRRAAGRTARRAEPARPRHAGLPAASPGHASARPTRPSRPWPGSTTTTATTGNCVSSQLCCGWPGTTRTRRPPHSPPCWTARRR